MYIFKIRNIMAQRLSVFPSCLLKYLFTLIKSVNLLLKSIYGESIILLMLVGSSCQT